MSDHARGCAMGNCYSVTTCPCCGRKITPARRQTSGITGPLLERELRRRPRSGAFEPDVDDDLGDRRRSAS